MSSVTVISGIADNTRECGAAFSMNHAPRAESVVVGVSSGLVSSIKYVPGKPGHWVSHIF